MSVKIACDRCNEIIADDDEHTCLLDTWDYDTDDGTAHKQTRSWHLCGGCHDRLLVYFFEESPANTGPPA